MPTLMRTLKLFSNIYQFTDANIYVGSVHFVLGLFSLSYYASSYVLMLLINVSRALYWASDWLVFPRHKGSAN
jgi:hypothetical protein